MLTIINITDSCTLQEGIDLQVAIDSPDTLFLRMSKKEFDGKQWLYNEGLEDAVLLLSAEHAKQLHAALGAMIPFMKETHGESEI